MATETMPPKERVRAGLWGLPTDRVPLHCRLRMAPLTPEYQWVRDLGWAVVGGHPGFIVTHLDVRSQWRDEIHDGRHCRRQVLHTSRGTLTSLETRNAAGGQMILEHLFKSETDYPALLALIRSTRCEPAYDEFRASAASLGNWGYAYSWAGFDPMHEIMINLMGIEGFSLEWMDHQENVLELYQALLDRHRDMFRIVADGPAEFVCYGGNISPTLVGRPRFERYYCRFKKGCVIFP